MSSQACASEDANTNCTTISSTDMPQQFTDALSKTIPWFDNAVIVTTGGVTIFHPKKDGDKTFYLDAGEQTVSREGSDFSFHKNNSDGVDDSVHVWDRDNNGSYEYLSYTYYDGNKEPLGKVIDFQRDGQLDMKIQFKSHSRSIWFKETWHPLHEKNNNEYINIDGHFVPVKYVGGRYVTKIKGVGDK